MVYPRFSYIIWTRKNYISFKSNNKQASKWRKNLKWKQHFYTNASWNYLILNMAVWWGRAAKEGKRQRRGGRRHWWAIFVWQVSIDTMWRNLLYVAAVLYLKSHFWISTRAFIIFQLVTRVLLHHFLPAFCPW